MNKIIFLHHSTGESIWIGDTNRYFYKLTRKGSVEKYFDDYNRKNNTNYQITSQIFPKKEPYGWKNYPYDYYNIWVKNAGKDPFMEEPTLEMLASEYDVIIFKHCYPVGRLLPDRGKPDIASEEKRLENYKLQYNALRKKMISFPWVKFIVWTPPASVKSQITNEEAERTYRFYKWMTEEWKEEDDNIYIWDFYRYETEGGLYLAEKNALSPFNSHPGIEFSGRTAPLFCEYIIKVMETPPSEKMRHRDGYKKFVSTRSTGNLKKVR